ncbi:hypothetical protein L195_g050056, partial [Trifolium pratense]
VINLATICTPVDYNTRPLDTIIAISLMHLLCLRE